MTKDDLEKYIEFLLTQNELSRKKNIRIVYRGDTLENLCKKLNVEYRGASTLINTILERLLWSVKKEKDITTN